MFNKYLVIAGLFYLVGCSGGGTSTASSATGAGGGGGGASSASATTGAGGGSASASTGTGGGSGCVPQPQIIACWAGDATMPPGPGTKSPSKCREYTGENGTKDPHQWDASCVPDSFTHAIATCPSGATSRCVSNCGKPQEFVDFNYDGGGSQLICEGSGGVWLMP
ncbi:MAG: hypothetical protein ABJE95_05640 [Byssovorax sp.]